MGLDEFSCRYGFLLGSCRDDEGRCSTFNEALCRCEANAARCGCEEDGEPIEAKVCWRGMAVEAW